MVARRAERSADGAASVTSATTGTHRLRAGTGAVMAFRGRQSRECRAAPPGRQSCRLARPQAGDPFETALLGRGERACSVLSRNLVEFPLAQIPPADRAGVAGGRA